MKILAFGDIHFHHTHRFSTITPQGYTIRELEHLQCADVIINLCKTKQIDKIVFLGDLFGPVGDNISCQVLTAVTEFIKKISDVCQLDMLVGNHDISGHLNNQYSHKLMPFKYWNNVTVYDQPTEVDDFIYLPYCINDQFAEDFLNNIKNKDHKIIFSHAELKGITFASGLQSEKGVSIDLLKKFKMTLQGHYHCGGSVAKNIQITGSTQRLSFKDQGIARNNIIIYDTETNKVSRESFNCPDWLSFTDDNINDLFKLSPDNYVKVELSTDLLYTDDLKEKLKTFKHSDFHVDVMRLIFNKKIDETEIKLKDDIDVIKYFVEKSENTEENKKELIKVGENLIERSKA